MTDQMNDEKKAALRKKVEYQVACEEKAFRIVERLIENPVEHDWFIDSVSITHIGLYHAIGTNQQPKIWPNDT